MSSILIVHNKGVGQEWFKGIPNVLTRNGWNRFKNAAQVVLLIRPGVSGITFSAAVFIIISGDFETWLAKSQIIPYLPVRCKFRFIGSPIPLATDQFFRS